MSDIAIKVEHLSKMYRLGEIGTGTISQDLNRWWSKVRGKEDPFAKIGEINDRTSKGNSNYVWVLNDINFQVKQGEVLGIVGRNGAGKSTLLKILSKVTAPTKGTIKLNGRIASLLEVGTGFHAELTGRENIFLNGAILGMTRQEIRKKFDEIVDFAGVERYIDTPVKRYSSGMYVRLAFAVAAFLEPEILIIDEVLAVGDAEFQKKCLGRMKDVSTKEGRTVLFVSHNMTAVRSLCDSAVLLQRGTVEFYGQANEVIDRYVQSAENEQHRKWTFEEGQGSAEARLVELKVSSGNDEVLYLDKPVDVYFKIQLSETTPPKGQLSLHFMLNNQDGVPVFNISSPTLRSTDGKFMETTCHIPAHFLNDDFYSVRLAIVEDNAVMLSVLYDMVNFKMEERVRETDWHGKWEGVVRPQKLIDWSI